MDLNDPANPGKVYNTAESVKLEDQAPPPPPKPVRKPDPSVRELRRQISGTGFVGASFGSIKKKSTDPAASGINLPPVVAEEDGVSTGGVSSARAGSPGEEKDS
jgi:hypothetical protein